MVGTVRAPVPDGPPMRMTGPATPGGALATAPSGALIVGAASDPAIREAPERTDRPDPALATLGIPQRHAPRVATTATSETTEGPVRTAIDVPVRPTRETGTGLQRGHRLEVRGLRIRAVWSPMSDADPAWASATTAIPVALGPVAPDVTHDLRPDRPNATHVRRIRAAPIPTCGGARTRSGASAMRAIRVHDRSVLRSRPIGDRPDRLEWAPASRVRIATADRVWRPAGIDPEPVRPLAINGPGATSPAGPIAVPVN